MTINTDATNDMETTETEEPTFVMPEDGEFDFPDSIEATAIEIVEENDEEAIDVSSDTSLEEVTEEKIDEMRRVFILSDELVGAIEDCDIPNAPLKVLYSATSLNCPEIIFNTSQRPSTLNTKVAFELFEAIKKHYNETFTILTAKVREIVVNLVSEVDKLNKDLLDDFDSIRYRANTVQTNYIKKDQGILNIFTAPLKEVYKLLEDEYVVSEDFKLIYKLCDETLGMADKPFAEIAGYLEVLYKDWLNSLDTLTRIEQTIDKVSIVERPSEDDEDSTITVDGYFESSFRDKLDLINAREKVESIVINTKRVKEILTIDPNGNITEIIMRVMFDEL